MFNLPTDASFFSSMKDHSISAPFCSLITSDALKQWNGWNAAATVPFGESIRL
jgi:hypothetical protein